MSCYKINFDYVHITFFLFLLKLPHSHSNFHIFWQRLWIRIIQLSNLKTLKTLRNREELENLDLPTINALFNKKDQFPDLNGLIIVKGTLDGNNLFFNKGGRGLHHYQTCSGFCSTIFIAEKITYVVWKQANS